MKEILEGNMKFFEFDVGEQAKVFRGRYITSHTTPLWTHGYLCTIIRYNKSGSVSVRIKDYEDETHYIDYKDLVPVDYDLSHLA